MSATTFAIENNLPRSSEMTNARLWHAYLTETRYECLRALRAPAFAIPFLLLPITLYVLFGVLLAGSMSHGDANVAKIMFVNWSVFGIMGPGMFGFGMFVAMEREQGLLTLKRALPAPPAAYLLSKMIMATLFSVLVMGHARRGGRADRPSRTEHWPIPGSRVAKHPGIAAVLRHWALHRHAGFRQERACVCEPGLPAIHASGWTVLSVATFGAAARICLARVLPRQTCAASRWRAQPRSTGGNDGRFKSRNAGCADRSPRRRDPDFRGACNSQAGESGMRRRLILRSLLSFLLR